MPRLQAVPIFLLKTMPSFKEGHKYLAEKPEPHSESDIQEVANNANISQEKFSSIMSLFSGIPNES